MAKQSGPAVLLAIVSISVIVAGQLLGGAQAADAPAMAPAPARLDCVGLAVSDLFDCFSYVQNGSTLKVPDKKCCSALSGYLKKQPTCLCSLASSRNQYVLSQGGFAALAFNLQLLKEIQAILPINTGCDHIFRVSCKTQ